MVLVLILSIDTSTPCGSVAVVRDGKVVGVVSTWTDEAYSSRMFRHVEMVLRELAIGFEQFDLFAVTTGPGSFTGLRVGMAAVKGWAEVYGKPIVGVNALEAIATQSRAPDGVLVPVLDARRGEVYFGFYRRRGAIGAATLTAEGETLVMAPRDFLAEVQATVGDQKGNQDFAIVTPTPEAIADELIRVNEARGDKGPIVVESVSGVLAPVVGEIAWRSAQAVGLVNSSTDSLTLDANYVRRTDAELKWKAS
jgi:tRNA threonylcarbamoyl adenosine modification protein YeaZ